MNLLTNRLTELYSNLNTPHCVFGLGGSYHLAHNRAQSGFFVCTIQDFRVMTGLNGETFGSVGSKCLPANPVQSCHLLLGGFGDGLKNLHLESNIMQNFNTNPSAIRPFAAILSFEVPTTELDPDFVPSVSLCVGEFETLAETEIACRSYANHPALIAMRAYQSMLANDYVGGEQ